MAADKEYPLATVVVTGLILLALWFVFLRSDGDEAEELPGDPGVYARIEALTDCRALQREFNIAMNNTEARNPSDPMHAVSLSYADAADERMSEIGCYE